MLRTYRTTQFLTPSTDPCSDMGRRDQGFIPFMSSEAIAMLRPTSSNISMVNLGGKPGGGGGEAHPLSHVAGGTQLAVRPQL